MVHESPKTLAWMRIISFDGKVLAESEQVTNPPKYTHKELRAIQGGRDQPPGANTVEKGNIAIVLMPLRFGPPPMPRRPPLDPSESIPEPPREQRAQPEFLETAVYLDGVSVHFGLLRENLIVGTAAGLALVGAVLILGLRFPHYMRGKRVEEELSLARRVQLDLFPAEDSATVALPFAARCVPALQVGGDLYDVFETDDGEVALVLGDVSGKGLPAALLMGVVQGAVRASCGTGAAANHEQAAERLNHLLCMKTARERFVSLFWCFFDRRDNVLRYINAGHLPPLLVRYEDAAGPRIIRLDQGGPVLGLLPGARYTQAVEPVLPGDLLVVFSDGILEATDAAGGEFGEEGIVACIEKNWNKPPAAICNSMLEAVGIFLGKELPHDDQTLLVVRLDQAAVRRDAETIASVQIAGD
jgi:sigma-B regulation protein RsbU (phosphoserine phosphatase)